MRYLLLWVAWGAALTLTAAAPPSAPVEEARPSVAVLYFSYDGKNPEMGMLRKGIAQMLISDLSFNERYQIVERDRLQALVDELELNQTTKIDPETANKMGKLLGAQYIVMGGYFDLFGSLRIDARVVEVETGKIVRSVGGAASPEAFLSIEQKVAKKVDGVLSTQLKTPRRSVLKRMEPKPTEPKGAEPVSGRIAPVRSRGRRPSRPKKLDVKTALAYSHALDALDKKDKKTAAKRMKAVLKAQPDFKLAELDLAELVE